MGLWAIYPGPSTSKAAPDHRIYPYLLRDVPIRERNQVWSTDITYIRLQRGFCYLVAVIDWFSRYVLSWEVASSLEASFCLEALDRGTDEGKRHATGVQLRPRRAVHKPGLHEPATGPRHQDQHGRARASAGQHIRRAVVAECEARGGVYQRLPDVRRCDERVEADTSTSTITGGCTSHSATRHQLVWPTGPPPPPP